MKQQFLRFERWTSAAAMVVACLMLALSSYLAIHQIVTRFILESPAEWTEVLIRFSLIWMVFLGIPTAFRQGAMVSVDLLYRLSGQRMRRVLDTVVAAAALTLSLVIFWWGLDYANRGSVQSMIGLEGVSMFWAYLAMPVGAAFSVISIIGNWLDPQRLELETAQ
ncbi:MAG: TRAP transporter small permease [Rubrivivax sp.]|jgi:TRAP-type C4-dicarboxylate transport system permease small subunit